MPRLELQSRGLARRLREGGAMRQPMTEPLASRDLAAFVHAMEAGTIQGAAEALCLTQSAATKRIQQLERRLGAQLLVRGRNGVSPTELGRALYPRACEVLAALHEAERTITGETGIEPLRLAASHTVGEFLLPAWLTEFRRADSTIQPRVDVVNSALVLEQLRSGRIEIGFVEGDDRLDEFDTVPVARDQILVVVGPGHRWARRSSLAAAELLDEPYIAREAGSGTRSIAEERLRGAGVRLTASFDLASLGGVKLSLAGGGFALISELAVQDEVRAGSLATVPLEGAKMERILFAVRADHAFPSNATKRFWEFLSRGRRRGL